MKKNILIAFVVAALAGLLVAGVAFAQDDNPPVMPFGDRGPRDGSGTLHNYMSEAMADALGMTVEELEASHEAGEYMYDIAEAQGLSVDDLFALMQDARTAALAAALEDGVMTQDQFEFMQSRGGMGHGGYGGGRGACDGTGVRPFDGTGFQGKGNQGAGFSG